MDHLTLKTAVTTASQNEMVQKQHAVGRPAEQSPNINLVYKKQHPQQGRSVQLRSSSHQSQDM